MREAVCKLYLITRLDLPPAQQAVQAIHAALKFALEWPGEARGWYERSNTLVLLGVQDEPGLILVGQEALGRGISHSAFREPDRGNELTAIAVAPEGRKICRDLKLFLGV
ncbi:MAG: hypothetical protein A2Z21_01860 [Candidatus Fraserbacteria bacterium RBG_16_55_9]|uniref:Uncharacterized protein n=1 Tax=Fraserbacteria sp. (strain RBG_16_55_9) TaxID=1817864 RepID=A0A1F5UP18_FRAXR|nr:MAG: hypothetical protein A2Z21_01860 [Candidatus Fraserbacteria bacterium RBG_16_55_9]